ncbi:MAG TPA: aspartate aminotransferase family protein [Longimicrobiales bacterium]|nr:aspartate aminotransferase family protein [Longimicrobiales bacterium]
MAERLRAVESRNVTHVSSGWPVFWEQARGANVVDADGNVYLDLTGAFGVALLGHAHPGVSAAVAEQAKSLVHGMGDVHPPSVKLRFLERLAALAPWPGARVVLSSTGSEAVETALKTALLATGRPGVLAFEGAYHGLTLGSLATTDRELFRAPFLRRMYGGVAFAPFPDPLRHGSGDARCVLEEVEAILWRGAPNGDAIGAVIVEPVQGRAGVRVPPDGFMAGLSALARERGALLVADEIFTGMGRCGALYASERVGLEPDLVCLGKALGGGLPLSACVGRRQVMDAWPESGGEAIHTSTFLGHPLSCAAGLAVLDALDGEGVPERAEALGRKLVEELRARLAGTDGVAEVRGLGLMVGIELARGPEAEPVVGAGGRAARFALEEGVLLLPAGEHGHVVELTPGVDLTGEQVALAVDVVARSVRRALA